MFKQKIILSVIIFVFLYSCGQESEDIVEVQGIADSNSIGDEDATVEMPDDLILNEAEAAKEQAEEKVVLAARYQAEAEAAKEQAEEEAALAERGQAEAETAKKQAEEDAMLAAIEYDEAEAAKKQAEVEAALAATEQAKAEATLLELEAALVDTTKYIFNGGIYNRRALDDTNDCDSSIECSGNELCLDIDGNEENAPSGDDLFPHNGDSNRPRLSLPGAIEECREP